MTGPFPFLKVGLLRAGMTAPAHLRGKLHPGLDREVLRVGRVIGGRTVTALGRPKPTVWQGRQFGLEPMPICSRVCSAPAWAVFASQSWIDE